MSVHLLEQTQIIGNKRVDYKEHRTALERVQLLQIEKCLLNIYESWGPLGEMSALTKHTRVVCGLERKRKYEESRLRRLARTSVFAQRPLRARRFGFF